VQTHTRNAAENAFGGLLQGMRSTLDSRMMQVRGQAEDALDNLEAIFQARVRRALSQLGVPSAAEVEGLSQRVGELNQSINRLSRKGKAAPRRQRRAHRARRKGTAHAAAT
jgi:poly(hydroxyalkanoate) granule-associated protein